MKGQNNFQQQNAFLTCSMKFLISNQLEQLEFKLEKKLGFRNMQENLEKYISRAVRRQLGQKVGIWN
jgi:hypothetical protein